MAELRTTLIFENSLVKNNDATILIWCPFQLDLLRAAGAGYSVAIGAKFLQVIFDKNEINTA